MSWKSFTDWVQEKIFDPINRWVQKEIIEPINKWFTKVGEEVTKAFKHFAKEVNRFFDKVREFKLYDPWSFLAFLLTESMKAIGLPKELTWVGVVAIAMFAPWLGPVGPMMQLGLMAAPDLVSKGIKASILTGLVKTQIVEVEKINIFASNFNTHSWYPGSDEWYHALPGGMLYNSTDLLQPWEVMNNRDMDLKYDGMYVSGYFDSSIPGATNMSFPGAESFFKGVD